MIYIQLSSPPVRRVTVGLSQFRFREDSPLKRMTLCLDLTGNRPSLGPGVDDSIVPIQRGHEVIIRCAAASVIYSFQFTKFCASFAHLCRAV